MAYTLESPTPCACSAPQRRRAGPPRENGYPLEQPPSLRHFPLGPPALWRNRLGRFFVSRKMLFLIPLVLFFSVPGFMLLATSCFAAVDRDPQHDALRGILSKRILTLSYSALFPISGCFCSVFIFYFTRNNLTKLLAFPLKSVRLSLSSMKAVYWALTAHF